MALILCIETSTTLCSVALVKEGQVVITLCEEKANSHAVLLTMLTEKMMREANVAMEKLDAIAVSSGPGSYTGLRIGVSTAKGLCFGLGIPLISLTSLEIMAFGASRHLSRETPGMLLCPMIDARRMEVYSALFTAKNEMISVIEAVIVDADSFRSRLNATQVTFFGNGADKCRDVIIHPNAFFVEGINPLASDMAELSTKKYLAQQFEDVAYFEPFYLKDFLATVPKNKFF
jgi:tRNA threonylcarbamoyladenosine biosynthesis protein TsaB